MTLPLLWFVWRFIAVSFGLSCDRRTVVTEMFLSARHCGESRPASGCWKDSAPAIRRLVVVAVGAEFIPDPIAERVVIAVGVGRMAEHKATIPAVPLPDTLDHVINWF